MKTVWILFGSLLAAGLVAQDGTPTNKAASPTRGSSRDAKQEAGKAASPPRGLVRDAKQEAGEAEAAALRGVEVRVKDIAHFRGVRSNQLRGYGLVVGLDGTGDSKKAPFSGVALANMLKTFGTSIDPNLINAKNIAAVIVTADLGPFTSPGSRIDVLVQSIGDARSLQGGVLLQTPLYAAGDANVAIAVAQGPLSIGGFRAAGGGNSVQKNHPTVGRIPAGAIVETAVATQLVFEGRSMYLDLDDPDLTTAQRLTEKIRETIPSCSPRPVDGGTVELTLPDGMDPVAFMSSVESLRVLADSESVVVVNERTGTIAIGGNVKLGPAVIAHGSLQVRIESEPIISQPAPFSRGETVVTNQTTVTAGEDTAQVALIPPNASVADLAKIFQALKLSPSDIIAILQMLKVEGALKARIKVQ